MTHSFEGASAIAQATFTVPPDADGPGVVLGYWKCPGGQGTDPVSLLDLVQMPEPLTGWVRGCDGFFDGASWVLVANGGDMVDLARFLSLPHVTTAEMVLWARERLASWLRDFFPEAQLLATLPGSGIPSWLELAEAMNPAYSRDELLTWIRCVSRRPVEAPANRYWWLVVPEDPSAFIADRDIVRLRGLVPIASPTRDQRDLVPWPDHSGDRIAMQKYRDRQSWASTRLDRDLLPPDDVRRRAAAAAQYLWRSLFTLQSVIDLVVAWVDEEAVTTGRPARPLGDVLARAEIELRDEVEDQHGPVPSLPHDIDDRVLELHRALAAAELVEDRVASSRAAPVGAELDAVLACAVDVVRAARSLGECVRFRDELAPR